MYNGKPYIPYYICVEGLYPYFDWKKDLYHGYYKIKRSNTR
jgi:hypothetical protein